jgi:NADPH2:quinone reductase
MVERLRVDEIAARHVLRAALRGLPARPRHIVQTGASSAVGKLITAFALRDGLTPIRLGRSAESAARLAASLPDGRIVNSGVSGWQAEVREAASGDIPVVVEGLLRFGARWLVLARGESVSGAESALGSRGASPKRC